MTGMRVSRRAVVAGMAALPFVPAMARASGGIGTITRLDPALDMLIDSSAPIEVLGTGYKWAEGPVWLADEECLLFNDVPSNICYRWAKGEGVTKFLEPSGLAGPIPAGIREAGANGMEVDGEGRLVMADSGSRAIARIDLDTEQKSILADKYDGKRFNSCNDVAIHGNGTIYFTDPPYGLAEGDDSPLKELDFNGVFRLSPDGEVHIVSRDLKRPNGIALSPDQSKLYVSMSDDERPEILVYALDADGGATDDGSTFFDMRALLATKAPGLPDGMTVDAAGNLFASGPGGIHVISADGRHLGTIATGKAIANCAFGGVEGNILFLTSSDMLACVPVKTSGW